MKTSKQNNTLRLEGNLSEDRMPVIKQEITDLLEKYPAINISISRVEHLDLQVLQMILAFQRAALSEGKIVKLDVQLPEQLQARVQQSGLTTKFNLS